MSNELSVDDTTNSTTSPAGRRTQDAGRRTQDAGRRTQYKSSSECNVLIKDVVKDTSVDTFVLTCLCHTN